MSGRLRIVFLGGLVFLASCARLHEAEPALEWRAMGTPGTVPVGPLGDSLSVPSEWGALVGVSQHGRYPATRLWLQDEDGTIRMLTYDHPRSVLWQRALVFRRGGEEIDAPTEQPVQ